MSTTHSETRPMSDGQIELALRNIRANIRQDCDGYFNALAVAEVVEHSPATGPELLYTMARVSLPILPAKDAARIVKNRAKALQAYVALQDRIGERRLKSHLSKQESFYRLLAESAFLDEHRVLR